MEPLKKSAQVAAVATDSTGHGQAETSIPPTWRRLPGEKLLWYNRFRLYLDLGYKRTVQGAVLKERAKLRALDGTEGSKKPEPVASTQRKQPVQQGHLQEVPQAKEVQVPGSWKQASIKYRWVERAAAYDAHRIDLMVENSLDDLMKEAATTFHRVMMLKQMLELMRTNLNKNIGTMTTEQIIAWIARMQSIMRDIREEMRGYDEHVTRVILHQQSTETYRAHEPKSYKELEQVAETMLAGAGGNREKLLAEIRREQTKRRREDR